VIVPRRLTQAGLGLNRGQVGTAVGLLLAGEFGNAKFNGGVLNSLETAESGLIDVSGYNSFEVMGVCSAGAGFSVNVATPDYNDTTTPHADLFSDVVGAIATPTGRQVFGALTAVRPNDSWGWIRLIIKGTAPTGATDVFVTLICSTR
jgi:hypothetical protein